MFSLIPRSDKPFFKAIRQIIGFSPKDISLYRLAFQHSSLSSDKRISIQTNERLEFLGDSILGAVVADCLYEKFPDGDEGFLTKTRSKVVKRSQLNILALRFGLDQFIQSNVKLEEGKSNAIYGDALEALIGAIYLDYGYAKAKHFIVDKIIDKHFDLEALAHTENDFKSKVIEWAQKEKKQFKFKLVKEIEEGNDKRFFIDLYIDNEKAGSGEGFSKKTAEQRAAKKAVAELGLE